MKKLLLASTALLAMAGTALAADLPSRKGAPIMEPIVPAFSWTGLYIGLNAGYGWNTNDNNNDIYGFGGGGSDDGGFVGGAQIGYNWQFNQFVLGAEADIQYADLKNKGSDFFDPVTGIYYGSSGRGVEWFGTVRARLGVAIDRALIYATGGFAYGGGGNDNNYFGYYGGGGDDVKTGWTLGGGIEYAFTPNLTAKLEGLYVNLGKQDRDIYYTGYYTGRKDLEFAVVRAGLNYKFDFGGAGGPVFARY